MCGVHTNRRAARQPGGAGHTLGHVIILDTNQLEYIQPPDGPLVAMLRTLSTQTGHALCLPEIAMEEHLAHYRRDVEEADRKLRTAEAELKALVPHLAVGPQPPVQLNQASVPL